MTPGQRRRRFHAPLFRQSAWDAVPLACAIAHGGLLIALAAAPAPAWIAAAAVALGTWWNANTVSHIHLHTPLFTRRTHNRAFSLYLTGLTCIPQGLWRRRHLWHHAGEPPGDRPSWRALDPAEVVVLATVLAALGVYRPGLLVEGWLPGYAIAMLLCLLHGAGEHAAAPVQSAPGVSLYNRLYNRLWLNDGFHAEHHRRPGEHWTRLPSLRSAPLTGEPGAAGALGAASRVPPVVRGVGVAANRLAAAVLDGLERIALRSRRAQAFLLDRHGRALDTVLRDVRLPDAPRIGVVGSGLFPRTALLLARRFPRSRLDLIDCNARHLALASRFLERALPPAAPAGGDDSGPVAAPRSPRRPAVTPVHSLYPSEPHAYDMLVFPLSYRGDRGALYAAPPAAVVLVHDWMWRRGHPGALVSPLLLKRLNLAGRGLPSSRSATDSPPRPNRAVRAAQGAVARAAGLLAAFALAKVIAVALRAHDGALELARPVIGLAGWSQAAAWLTQDVIAAAAWVACDLALSTMAWRVGRDAGRRIVQTGLWAAWGLALALTAVSTPVARWLGTPLTPLLMRASSPRLSDSIAPYLTWDSLLAVGCVVAGGLVAARATPRFPQAAALALSFTILAVMAGAALSPSAEGAGALARNPLGALLTEVGRRPWSAPGGAVAAAAASAPGRGRLPEGAAVDLAHLRGAAAGFNVIWVMLESHGAGYLGAYGARPDPTPNLTRLAETGLVFEWAYAAYPESVKGLYATLCSRHVAPWTAAEDYAAERRGCESPAVRLAARGYATGLFHSGHFDYLGMADVLAGRGFDRLVGAADVNHPEATTFGVPEPAMVDAMLRWLDGLPRGRPFFLMYLPVAGHHPYEAPGPGPRPFAEEPELSRYTNDLFEGDAALGNLVAGVESRGLADRTLWVVTGDHGEAFYQHPGNFAHTLYLYEENVRVPFVIAAPRVLPARRVPQIVSLIDVAPTWLDLLGLPADLAEPAEPAYPPEPAGPAGRTALQPRPGRAIFMTDFAELRVGMREGRWKAILEPESRLFALYDLATDPLEARNLAAAEPGRAATFSSELQAHLAGMTGRTMVRD